MTPGDHFGYLGIENRFTFLHKTPCIHLRLQSVLRESGWKMGGLWLPRKAGACAGWGDILIFFCSEIGIGRRLWWSVLQRGGKGWSWSWRVSGGWGDTTTLSLDTTFTTWHHKVMPRAERLPLKKWQRVRLFAWAGWMHRNNLMHTTQRGVAHAENIQCWSSERSLVLGWVFIWSSIQCGWFCVLSSQFLQNKQFYQWNLPFGRVDSKQFHSRYAGVRIHPHLKPHIHSSDIAIYILLYRCLLVTYDIIR